MCFWTSLYFHELFREELGPQIQVSTSGFTVAKPNMYFHLHL